MEREAENRSKKGRWSERERESEGQRAKNVRAQEYDVGAYGKPGFGEKRMKVWSLLLLLLLFRGGYRIRLGFVWDLQHQM